MSSSSGLGPNLKAPFCGQKGAAKAKIWLKIGNEACLFMNLAWSDPGTVVPSRTIGKV